MLIFEQKELNSFLKDQKLPKFYNTYFFKYFFNEKVWKFWHLMANKLKGWSHKLETLHVKSLGAILKKLRKQKNCGGSPSLCNWHLKFTNIFQIFHNLIQSQTIWINFWRALVNWSPQFDSHSFHSLFELQLILWQFYCCSRLLSTRTQI